MSLGTNYSLYCLECCQYLVFSYREDCLMCRTNKVIKRDAKSFWLLLYYRRITRRQVMRHFIGNGTGQMLERIIESPHSISRATSIDSDYCPTASVFCNKADKSRSNQFWSTSSFSRPHILCVSGQRGTIAKSTYEEHLCVVALTSIERGTQFFPLASYFLV